MNTLALPASSAPAPTLAAPATDSTPAPFRIAVGAVLTLREGRNLCVEVIAGRLWVTHRGDAADHFVGPGGRLPLGRARAVVIENVGTTSALLRLVHG